MRRPCSPPTTIHPYPAMTETAGLRGLRTRSRKNKTEKQSSMWAWFQLQLRRETRGEDLPGRTGLDVSLIPSDRGKRKRPKHNAGPQRLGCLRMKDEGSSGGGRARLAVVADGEVADEDDKVHCVCGCSERGLGKMKGVGVRAERGGRRGGGLPKMGACALHAPCSRTRIDRDVLEVTAEPDLSDQVDELRAGSRPMQMRSRKGGRERAKEERVSLFLLRCRSCSNEPRYEPHGQPRPGSRLRKPALGPALGPPPVGAALNTHTRLPPCRISPTPAPARHRSQ